MTRCPYGAHLSQGPRRGSLRWADRTGKAHERTRAEDGAAAGPPARSATQVRHVVKVSAEQEARLLEVATAQGMTVPRLLVEAR